MQLLDVCKKDCGKIWHRKPSPGCEGLLVTITNTVSSPLSLHSRNVRILHAAFDVTGDSFVAGDHQGNIFLFDIHRNRFALVQRTGSPCSALAFSLRRKTEFLVGMSDYTLKCFDTDTKELVAWMKGHDSVIQTISVHASGRYALTASHDIAQLWDLDTFQRKRKLNIKENIGITKVFFLPLSNTIITCFKDDSIFAWESDTLTCKYQLKVPDGTSPHFKDLAATRDGRLLVGGGKSRFLHIWALDTQKLQRIMELPKKVTSVRQLEFLPDSFDAGSHQILGVLCQDGIMRFVNISTCKHLFDLGSLDERLMNIAVSPTGKHVVAVTDSGNLNLYSVQALTSELHQPPPPLVKVLKGNKMADTTVSCDAKQKKPIQRTGKLGARAGKENKNSTKDTSTNLLPDGLNMSKLMNILKGYGEYPAKYRMFIWRSILRLPENHAAYGALVDKGTHPAYEKLHQQYPIKSRKLLRVLQRVLSALAHWSPIFGETEFLPMLAFPFVKLFQNNQLVSFEVIATILCNWCQHWFEYFPNPPINVLGIVENVLAYHDKELLQHFVKYGITSQIYAWPLLQTLFSEVLTREEWLKLFDNLFSNPPSFLMLAVVAYSLTSRGPLMQCTETDDFQYFYHHRNAVDVKHVISEAYRLNDVTPEDIHPRTTLDEFEGLTPGQYPVFNKYPKFIVDYQVQERERIRQEEMDYLRQRQASLELQKETQLRQQEEDAWYRQQQLLVEAEQKRRNIISEEEQKLADQRTRLTAMNRELKLKELQVLDATRRKFVVYQQQQKESELTRLDDEIRRKAELRETETKAAMEDVEIRNMELQVQKNLLEQELHREFVEADQKQKADYDARRKQQEIEDRVAENLERAERDAEQRTRRTLQQNLAKAEQINADLTVRNQLECRLRLQELEKERKALQLARLKTENRRVESSYQELVKETEKQKLARSERRYDELQEERELATQGETRRLHLLQNEVNLAERHLRDLNNTRDEMFENLRTARQRFGGSEETSSNQSDRCLNDSGSTERSTQFSLDRGRETFEAGERELMAEVRRLRQKLAKDSRTRKPPPAYNIES